MRFVSRQVSGLKAKSPTTNRHTSPVPARKVKASTIPQWDFYYDMRKDPEQWLQTHGAVMKTENQPLP